jgi:hypothetical protein
MAIHLVRVDEYARPRETIPELHIDVTSTTHDSKDVRYVLQLEEVCQLADRLMTECHQAQFLNHPATAAATASGFWSGAAGGPTESGTLARSEGVAAACPSNFCEALAIRA